jgi:putative transcriptional regulator
VPQLLRNKNMATRFQILIEIAANQPYIQQKDIAKKIGITSQGVSDYVIKLEKEGWISSEGRSRYRVTKEGVNWVLTSLRELQQYCSNAEHVITNIDTWAAIADADLKQGQTIGLVMKDGLLFATTNTEKEARGVTTHSAHQGEDVGITAIEGIVSLEQGKITILEIPDIQGGGSRSVNLDKLKKQLAAANFTGAIGTESFASLKRLNIEPEYAYGVTQAAIESAHSGLDFTIVCIKSASLPLQQRLTEENIAYKIINVSKR